MTSNHFHASMKFPHGEIKIEGTIIFVMATIADNEKREGWISTKKSAELEAMMPKKMSLRVGGRYRDYTGTEVSIVDCSLQREGGFYYIDHRGDGYRMDGSSDRGSDRDLIQVVDLDNVPSPTVEVGGVYETERHDKVRICDSNGRIEGFPFRSDVGDFYNDKGERLHATPGSHLVKKLDR